MVSGEMDDLGSIREGSGRSGVPAEEAACNLSAC